MILMWNDDRALVDRFLKHYRTPRGQVRVELITRQILDHLPAAPARLVDVGAGGGQQAVALAHRGCHVTLVEPSPLMRARAEELISDLPPELRARLTILPMTGEQAAHDLGSQGFDGVLCHGVLMYLSDPEPQIQALARLCVPGGLVSVVTKNAAALAYRPALQGDFAEALASFGAQSTTGWLGATTRGDTVEGLAAVLQRHGVTPQAWYGVGVFSDHRTDLDDLPEDQLSALQAVEYEASRRDPYRATARLIHVLGRRPSAP
jgi:S-adenosylmethionine-dependent methyltransferase